MRADLTDSVGAATVRRVLEVSAHQLSEMTAALSLEVGPRPNYPRYDASGVHRMLAVTMLRQTQAPVRAALKAGAVYDTEILAGTGWLLLAPGDPDWTVAFLKAPPDLLVWLGAAGGRGIVLALDVVASRAREAWASAADAEG